MPSIQINSVLVTLTTNGSTTGYITVADNGPIFPNAKGWLTDGTKSQYCIVTDLIGSTQIGLRFISSTGAANNSYGRNDCSSYLTGSTFNQELQTCEVEEPLSIKDGSPGGMVTQLIAGSNITLSPTSGIGPVTVSAVNGNSKGADIASATTITPTQAFNYYQVTGSVTITYITFTGFQDGNEIELYFASALILTNNGGAPPGTAYALQLVGAVDASMAAGSKIRLRIDSALTKWVEMSRSAA